MNDSTKRGAQLTVQTLDELIIKVQEHLKKYNHASIIELHKRILEDETFKEEFINDPNTVVERETGIPSYVVMNNGKEIGHYHFIDQNNNYFPPEGPEERSGMFEDGEGTWFRLEIRLAASHGTSVATCYYCPAICIG